MSDSEKPILETIKIEKPEVNVGELKKKLKLSRDEMKLMNKKVTHYRRRTLCPTLTDFEKYNMLKKHTGRNTITYKENIKLQNLGNSIDNPFLHNGKGQKISVRSCQADIAYKEEPISNCSITPLENLNKYLKIINNFKCQNRSLRLTNAHVDKDSNFSNSEMSAFSSGTQKGKNMNTSDFQITKHLTLSDNNINYKDNLSIPLRHNATMYNINQKNYRRSKSLQESFSTQSLHVHRNSKTISPWFKIINKLTKGIKKRPSTINIDKIKKTSIHRSCDSSISINDVYNNLTSDYRKKMMKWEKKNNREKHLFKNIETKLSSLKFDECSSLNSGNYGSKIFNGSIKSQTYNYENFVESIINNNRPQSGAELSKTNHVSPMKRINSFDSIHEIIPQIQFQQSYSNNTMDNECVFDNENVKKLMIRSKKMKNAIRSNSKMFLTCVDELENRKNFICNYLSTYYKFTDSVEQMSLPNTLQKGKSDVINNQKFIDSILLTIEQCIYVINNTNKKKYLP